MKKLFLVAVILAIVFSSIASVLVAPGQTPQRAEADGPDIIFSENTKLLGAPSSISADKSTLVFSDDTIVTYYSSNVAMNESIIDAVTHPLTSPRSLIPGDIIICGVSETTPYGLLRNVSSVSIVGDQIVVGTTNCTLEEAFQKLPINFNKTLTPEDITEGISLAYGVSINKNIDESFGLFRFVFTDFVLYSTSYGQIVANGNVTFNATIHLDFNIENGKLQSLNFTDTFSEALNLEITTTGNLTIPDKEIQIGYIPLATIPIGPITITPELYLYVGCNGTFSASISAGITQSNELTTGLSYDRVNDWQTIKNNTPHLAYKLPTLDQANANLKAYAEGRAALLIMGGVVLGGGEIYAGLAGDLEFDADINRNPWWTLYGGLELNLGAKLKLLIWTVADYEKTVIDSHILLSDSSTPPPQSKYIFPGSTMDGMLWSGWSGYSDPYDNAGYQYCWNASTGSDYYAPDPTSTAFGQLVYLTHNSGGDIAGHYYGIGRAFVYFDTSSIPNPANIISARLHFYVDDKNISRPFNVVVQDGQPTYPHAPLQGDDFYQGYYSGNGGSVDADSLVLNAYNSIRLNNNGEDWINRQGTTKLCLRDSNDVDALPSYNTSYEWIGFACAESDQWPYLEIIYDIEPQLISTSSLSFNTINGSTPESQTLIINNSGGGNIGFILKDNAPSWLCESSHVGVVNSTTNANIAVSINSSGLSAGYYNAAIAISSTSSDQLQVIPVSLCIAPEYHTVQFNSSASSGYVYNDSIVDYSTAWNSPTGSPTSNTNYVKIGQEDMYPYLPDHHYYICRGFLFFDTSSIPDNAYITSANLSFRAYDTSFVRATNLVLQNGMPTYPHDPLQPGDYYYGFYDNYTDNGGMINFSDISSSTYSNISLNGNSINWINKTGTTKFCLRTNWDISSSPPVTTSSVLSEQTNIYNYKKGPGYWPYLKVTYATFDNTPTTYTLTASNTSGGTVTTPGIGNFTYNFSQVVPFVASNYSCYKFVNWTSSGSVSIANPTTTTTNVTVNGTGTVTANFALITYTLSVSNSGNGSTTPSGTSTRNCSEVVNISATANSCYRFVNWSGTGASSVANVSNASTTITMNGDFSIQANFIPITSYTLTTSNTSGGTVTTPGIGNFTRNCSQVVPIVATNYSCYKFVNWTGNTSTIANPNSATTTITLNGNYSIKANFAIKTYIINYTAGTGGTISGTKTQTVNCGTNGTAVIAIPKACYRFVNWSDGNNISMRRETNVNSNISVTANFAPITYTLTTSNTSGGTVTTPGIGNFTYNCNQVILIIASNYSCYTFVNWTGTAVTAGKVVNPNSPVTNINMSGNYSVQANFAPITYTLTTSNTSGGTVVSPGIGNFTRNCSQVYTIVASSYSCYRFVNWTGTAVTAGKVANPNSSATTINMSGNYSLKANFVLNTYRLNVSANNSGGSPSFNGTSPFNCGTTVSIYANTKPGYTFVGWTPTSGVANASAANTTILVNQNRSLTAAYELTGDLNLDGHRNDLDVALVTAHWGQTGTPCWIPEDLNCDGAINILDVVFICDHWTD